MTMSLGKNNGENRVILLKQLLRDGKVLLSIWSDIREIIFFELRPRNETINSDVYCEQLQKLSCALQEKRPQLLNRRKVIFHHDNARPHTSIQTPWKLLAWRGGMFYCIYPFFQTLPPRISICFNP